MNKKKFRFIYTFLFLDVNGLIQELELKCMHNIIQFYCVFILPWPGHRAKIHLPHGISKKRINSTGHQYQIMDESFMKSHNIDNQKLESFFFFGTISIKSTLVFFKFTNRFRCDEQTKNKTKLQMKIKA